MINFFNRFLPGVVMIMAMILQPLKPKSPHLAANHVYRIYCRQGGPSRRGTSMAHPLPGAVLSLATDSRPTLAATRFLQSPYSDRSDLRFESLCVKEIRRVIEFREIKTVAQ
jgi:hypothetical protein